MAASVTLYHPVFENVTRRVDPARVDAWVASGWLLEEADPDYVDHADVFAVQTETGVSLRAILDDGTEITVPPIADDEGLAAFIQDDGTATGSALASTFALKSEAGWSAQNAALEGAPLYAYGHSYVAGTGVTDPLSKWTSIFQREYMKASAQVNRAVGGHTMEQTLTEIISNATRRWTPGTKGVVVLQSVLNNVLRTNAGNESQTLTSFRNALTTAMRVLRSSAYVVNTDASVVFTGTWGTTPWSTSRSGNLRGSSVSGDTVKIAGYADTEIGLMLWAGKLPTSVEARYDVLVNGAKFGDTRDLSNKWSSESDINPSAGQAMLCEWITGLPAGVKEITIQVLPSSANTAKNLYFDGYLKPHPAPPTVIVVKDAPVGTYTGAALTTDEADILLGRLNAVIDDVVASYSRPGEVVAADAGVGFKPSTMLGGVTGTDLLHPNASGHAAIAKAVNRTAQGIPYRRANFA